MPPCLGLWLDQASKLAIRIAGWPQAGAWPSGVLRCDLAVRISAAKEELCVDTLGLGKDYQAPSSSSLGDPHPEAGMAAKNSGNFGVWR